MILIVFKCPNLNMILLKDRLHYLYSFKSLFFDPIKNMKKGKQQAYK
jgi:hypothetical protein